MKKTSFLVFVFSCICFSFVNAQELSFESSAWGFRYYIDGTRVDHRDFKSMISKDKVAGLIYKSYTMNKGISQVLSGAGGFLIGYPVGQSFRNYTDPNWKLAIAGGVLVGLGIIFEVQYKNKTKDALEVYHSNLTFREPIKISIGANEHGLGLRARF